MKKIHSINPKSEIMVRKKLWALGYRYFKNYRRLPGKPDIAFTKYKIAIFIDGEFWHGYNWEEKRKKIKSNRDYWISKIEKNIQRDKRYNELLKKQGYIVIRIWEKEIKRDFDNCINQITNIIEERRKKLSPINKI